MNAFENGGNERGKWRKREGKMKQDGKCIMRNIVPLYTGWDLEIWTTGARLIFSQARDAVEGRWLLLLFSNENNYCGLITFYGVIWSLILFWSYTFTAAVCSHGVDQSTSQGEDKRTRRHASSVVGLMWLTWIMQYRITISSYSCHPLLAIPSHNLRIIFPESFTRKSTTPTLRILLLGIVVHFYRKNSST